MILHKPSTKRQQEKKIKIFDLFINLTNYLSYWLMAIVSIVAAIYLPFLGLIVLLGLAAIFFDYNKKIYGRYFVSPTIFFDKERKLRPYHELIFYLFSISLLVNLMTLIFRLVRTTFR